MKVDRTPCINPRCSRTANRAKFPDEMICGKCFKLLPPILRQRHKKFWRLYRKHEKRLLKNGSESNRNDMNRAGDLIDRNWERIKASFHDDKPEGIAGFLEEMGWERT